MLYISLDESEGVTIKSDNDIVFSAEQDITLEAKKIEIKAQQEIILACRESSIILTEEQLGINSPQTSIEGSEKKEYPSILSEYEQQQVGKTEKKKDKGGLLDKIQLGLDVAGMIPVVGAVPDLINAGVSVARGDKVGAVLCLCSAVPGIGDIAGAAKISVRAGKVLSKLKGKLAQKAAPLITKAVDTISKLKTGVAKVTTKASSAMADGADAVSKAVKGLIEDVKAGKFSRNKPRDAVDPVESAKREKDVAKNSPESPEPKKPDKPEGTGTRQIKELVDSPFNAEGHLKPNVKYRGGEFDYNYETDALGRLEKFQTDDLRLTWSRSEISAPKWRKMLNEKSTIAVVQNSGHAQR